MTDVGIHILIILGLILANGVFSLAELAIVSARRSRLKERAEAGSRRAEIALALAEDPNRFLSTVQIGITLIGTLAGVFSGATLGRWLAERLATHPALAPYAEPLGLGLVVLAITYVTLVLGELVPKRLAMSRPERVALLVARPLRVLSALTIPVVKLLSLSTEAVLWVLRARGPAHSPVTEDDIKHMVREGLDAGVLEPGEQEMILSVFRLTDRRAGSLMTPRNEIVWIDSSDSPEEMKRKISGSPHSSFPVCDGCLDNILGVVRVKDLLIHGFAERHLALKGRLTMPLFIYEGTRGPRILEMMRKNGQHFTVVLDEYGSVEGVLTMTDLLEALVGDLSGEDQTPAVRAVQREDGSWLLDGSLSPEELGDLRGLSRLPRGDYHTLAGFLITQLGRIPRVAEVLVWEEFRFEVVDMDGNRVDRVLVSRIERPR